MTNHKPAIITIALAVVLDVLGALLFAVVEHLSVGISLYWAVATATTVGYGDVAPHTVAGHWIAVLIMLSVIPLVSATFSIFTSGLTAGHVRRSHHELREHFERLFKP